MFLKIYKRVGKFKAVYLCRIMRQYFSLVKFAHTVFALPFALTGFALALATHPLPLALQLRLLLLVLLCMIFARNAAMGFNRWLDRDIDAANPRTQQREIPAGVIAPRSALAFVAINALFFIAATWFINPLCFALSPVALLVVLGYSYTKRFTWLCHVVLGLGLGLAPVGAYIAVTGRFDSLVPVLLGLAVMLWTAGFDVIYALQDESFDRENRLYSMPRFFGAARALRVSEALHLGTGLLLTAVLALVRRQEPGLTGLAFILGTTTFLSLLIQQHRLVKPNDLRRVNQAFFTTNGIASVIYGSCAVLDLMI